MSGFGEIQERMKENIGEMQKPGIYEAERPKLPWSEDLKKLPDTPFQVNTDVYDDILRKNGFVSEAADSNESDKKTDSGERDKDYLEYLEKRDDGKYYDKETGRAYDSVEQCVKAQEMQAKRYEGASKYYEEKAKKEWARFKNAEENGESDAAKWEHYKKSQEYYARAKECKEKAQKIREKLGQSNGDTSESKSLQQDEAGVSLKSTFDAVPSERREDVKNSFQDSPDGIKQVVDCLEDALHVEDSQLYMNEDGTFTYGTSCYSPEENIIYMNPEYDNDEYAEVFAHEYGHFVDAQLGDVSSQSDFVFAMDADIDNILAGDTKGQMLDELASSDAIYDRSVSDILSGAFMNDEDIRMRYWDEAAPYYSHSNEYWMNGPDNAREKEAFANLFRIYSDSERADSKAFVEKYFPNTCEQFKTSFSI